MDKQTTPCPVCGQPLSFRLARGRKSGKPFIQLVCAQDGRHFRGFIGDKPYIDKVLNQLEDHQFKTPGDVR